MDETNSPHFGEISILYSTGTSLDETNSGTSDGSSAVKRRRHDENTRSASIRIKATSVKELPDTESLTNDLSHLLDNNVMSDIKLKCGDVEIPAHKAILAARSEVFSAMLQHEMTEKQTGIVDIKDVDPSVLQMFVRYLYSGKIPHDVSKDMICELYAIGDQYSVPSLNKLCASYLASNLNEENFTEILMLAHNHNDTKLKDNTADFIISCPRLMVTHVWMNFSVQFPKLANEIYNKYVVKTLSR